MSHWTELVNFSIGIAGIVLMLLGLLLAASSHFMERWMRLYFIRFFSLMTVYVTTNLAGQLADYYNVNTDAQRILLFMESLFSSMLVPLLLQFVLRCSGEDWRMSVEFWYAGACWVLYVALLIYTQLTTSIYYYDEQGLYHRGAWYPVLLVLPIVTLLLTLVALLRRIKSFTVNQLSTFIIYLLAPTIAMILQMYFYGLYLIVLGTEISGLIMFFFILREQMEENSRQQINIMMLQMRPHYICNTLSSIYYLCDTDAKKAQRVIGDFTGYLQRNFRAISKKELVPFEEELEHTRAYLSVEEVRFEKQLYVTFDTPHRDFRLPPLTLQPLVENAVKYGVSQDLEALNVTIRTQKTETGSEITVEDTGPGYQPAENDGSHIALSNIEKRLKMMCNATLEILPREGGGTTVRVVIPER